MTSDATSNTCRVRICELEVLDIFIYFGADWVVVKVADGVVVGQRKTPTEKRRLGSDKRKWGGKSKEFVLKYL